MDLLIVLGALFFLIFVAYKGYSVILFAPIAALGAVFFTDPAAVAPMFTGVFMDKMVIFIKNYFPVFLLGAIFGKVIELSGFSKSIVAYTIKLIGEKRSILAIVMVCAILTYGGVSLFVVVFAVYPFAAEMFRQSNIPKRLIPGTIALGAFSFTMDALPGTPQIQNIIPTTFFGTTSWAAPWLGLIGSIFVLTAGLSYLEWRKRVAHRNGEGYGENLLNEPQPFEDEKLPNPFIALLPLLIVGVLNLVFTKTIPIWYGSLYELSMPGFKSAIDINVNSVTAIWAVQGALTAGILTVLVFSFKNIVQRFAEGSKQAISGALLAAMNTASEYGFGAVIASLAGFLVVADAMQMIPNPLINEAITVTTLAGVTGSASGGLVIALETMGQHFITAAEAMNIPMQVLHRVASMASGGMDTLPHNGAVITLLSVTGLTHKQSYKDIFAVTIIKTLAVFFIIAVYTFTGIV